MVSDVTDVTLRNVTQHMARRRSCRWCKKQFPSRRKGHQFCSTRCRMAAWRRAAAKRPRERVRSLGGYWPKVRALDWTEVHVDAGRFRDRWWGGFVAWRHTAGGRGRELVVERRGRILPDDLPGPTPVEGIAVLHAFRWMARAGEEGIISTEDPLIVAIDNRPVAAKVGTGNPRGIHRDVWEELAQVTEPFRRGWDLRVMQIRGGDNEADHLARPHEDPEMWTVSHEAESRE